MPMTLALAVLVVLPSTGRVPALPRDVREAKQSCIFFHPFASSSCPIYTKVTRRVMKRQMEKPHQQKYLQPFIGYGRCFLHHHTVVKKITERRRYRQKYFISLKYALLFAGYYSLQKNHLKDQ